jgi:polysaccharide export outer membrane protein
VRSTGKLLSFWLIICLLSLQTAVICPAQTEDQIQQQEMKSASQYYLERGTESKLMIKVNVWGAVKQPGSQYVPDGTDLISVLSAAGGPTDGAKLSRVKLVRNFNGDKHHQVINISAFLKKGDVQNLPEMKPGDTVIVPKSGVSFGKFLGVIYNVAVIASVVKLMTD